MAPESLSSFRFTTWQTARNLFAVGCRSNFYRPGNRCCHDGSTDDSPQIVARFARQDPRIVIIDRPNEGVAYARKHGVEAARGEYIQYLDGDDFLEPDAIELLYRKAVDEQADMVVLPFWLESENRKKASNPTPGTYDSVSFFYSWPFAATIGPCGRSCTSGRYTPGTCRKRIELWRGRLSGLATDLLCPQNRGTRVTPAVALCHSQRLGHPERVLRKKGS